MKIAPSMLSADFGRLNDDIKTIEPYADLLHVDVMDGNFVGNLTFGPVVVKDIKTSLPLDVHLMIKEPLKYADKFSKYAEMISFHASLFDKNGLSKAVQEVKSLDVKVGLALNPDDPVEMIEHVLGDIDFVLIMSVYAGFAGQKFIQDVLKKIEQLRAKYKFEKQIEIDGGINDSTIKEAAKAGADIFVAGSFIFKNKDRQAAISRLRGAI